MADNGAVSSPQEHSAVHSLRDLLIAQAAAQGRPREQLPLPAISCFEDCCHKAMDTLTALRVGRPRSQWSAPLAHRLTTLKKVNRALHVRCQPPPPCTPGLSPAQPMTHAPASAPCPPVPSSTQTLLAMSSYPTQKDRSSPPTVLPALADPSPLSPPCCPTRHPPPPQPRPPPVAQGPLAPKMHVPSIFPLLPQTRAPTNGFQRPKPPFPTPSRTLGASAQQHIARQQARPPDPSTVPLPHPPLPPSESSLADPATSSMKRSGGEWKDRSSKRGAWAPHTAQTGYLTTADNRTV